MKKILSFALSVLCLCGCNNEVTESVIESETVNKVTVTVAPMVDQSETRTALSKDANNNTVFVWSNSDEIGIFPNEGYQTGFSMACAAGSTSAEFTGGGWGLKASSTYAAYYPFIHDIDLNKSAIPLDYTGQTQNGNGNSDHLSAYDFMTAPASTASNGTVNFNFGHLGTLLHLKLTIPVGGVFKSIVLQTDGSIPVTSSLNLVENTLTSVSYSNELSLNLTNISLNANDVLDAYMFIPAVNLSNNSLTATVKNQYNKKYTATLAGKNFVPGDIWNFSRETYEQSEDGIPYLTFTAASEQNVKMTKAVETLEYSVNNGDWQTLGTNTVTFGGENGILRLRGKSSKGTGTAGMNYSNFYFYNDTPVACSGDIRTLVDYENYKTADTSGACFYKLFQNCIDLTSAPDLPATVLANNCYRSMFDGCINLVKAPVLPAEILASCCYYGMFNRCSSLTQVPILPATTLADYCYSYMFNDCSSLTQAPELPATTLADYCYSYMFDGCSSLTQAPNLPASSLSNSCYLYMFNDCTSLTKAPELPATTLAEQCYQSMFNNCGSLTQAPELPATTLTDNCYNNMFYGCGSLTQAPELPAKSLTQGCYSSMFALCVGLTSVPSLPATTLAEACYNYMFYYCDNITQAPELPAETLVNKCYYYMFYGCSKLNYIKMLATDIDGTECLSRWTYGVSYNGTFVKNADATWNVTGPSGIPSNWTVKTDIK